MKFIPKRKLIKGHIAPDSAKIQDVTPQSWGEIERLIKTYLLLTGGTVSGNLTVTGNTQLGNASTDTVGLYDATATARQNHITDASTAHALNATFSDTEVEAALNALGTIINSILVRIETIGINKTS